MIFISVRVVVSSPRPPAATARRVASRCDGSTFYPPLVLSWPPMALSFDSALASSPPAKQPATGLSFSGSATSPGLDFGLPSSSPPYALDSTSATTSAPMMDEGDVEDIQSPAVTAEALQQQHAANECAAFMASTSHPEAEVAMAPQCSLDLQPDATTAPSAAPATCQTSVSYTSYASAPMTPLPAVQLPQYPEQLDARVESIPKRKPVSGTQFTSGVKRPRDDTTNSTVPPSSRPLAPALLRPGIDLGSIQPLQPTGAGTGNRASSLLLGSQQMAMPPALAGQPGLIQPALQKRSTSEPNLSLAPGPPHSTRRLSAPVTLGALSNSAPSGSGMPLSQSPRLASKAPGGGPPLTLRPILPYRPVALPV